MSISNLGSILLREINHLAHEKFLDPQAVIASLEQAFQKASFDTYGAENDIRVTINRKDGTIHVYRYRRIVPEVHDVAKEVELSNPLVQAQGLKEGDELVEELPLPAFDRGTVQRIKGALIRNIQDIEREAQYQEFKNRVGQITSGTVKRIEGGNIILDLGRAEGIILRDEIIPRESFRTNDRVKAYIYAVRREPRGAQIFLSRTHPGFLAKLFAQEVPEIADGLIEIKAVARDPGSRAKMAIFARDIGRERAFDPMGACVGVKGNRVKAVSQELQGEKIDIVMWSSELPTFVVNALTPAEAVKVILEGDIRNTLTVVVPDSQQSIAIGRRGQNVRLAHQLTGAYLEIVTESDETTRRNQERQERTTLFMEKLSLDELMAHFLVAEGFETIEEIVRTPLAELVALEGFTPEIAEELKDRAEEALQEEHQQLMQQFRDSGGEQALIDLGVPVKVLPHFTKENIRTVQDLAELSLEELLKIVDKDGAERTSEEWGQLIMKARRTHA